MEASKGVREGGGPKGIVEAEASTTAVVAGGVEVAAAAYKAAAAATCGTNI